MNIIASSKRTGQDIPGIRIEVTGKRDHRACRVSEALHTCTAHLTGQRSSQDSRHRLTLKPLGCPPRSQRRQSALSHARLTGSSYYRSLLQPHMYGGPCLTPAMLYITVIKPVSLSKATHFDPNGVS